MRHDAIQPAGERSDVELATRILSERAESTADGQGRPIATLRRGAADVAKRPYPTAAVITVEIHAGEGGHAGAAIDVAAGDGASVGVTVLDDRKDEAGHVAARRPVAVLSFHDAPA